VSEPPESCRRLRFTLDAAQFRLRVADRAGGTELYTIPLPLAELPTLLQGGEIYYQAVDHLLVLCVGPSVLGVDLIGRRVRWSRRVTDGLAGTVQTVFNQPDGRLALVINNQLLGQRLGLIGPVGPSAVCVRTPRGLLALDPLTGAVRWARTDVPEIMTIFGDEEYLFLDESFRDGGVRGVRAVRARDGVTVPIPDATAAYAGQRRILGRHLLVAETAPSGKLNVRLYDPLTGKDLWQRTVAARSLLLSSPEPHRIGIVEPKGSVAVIDLNRRQEIAHLMLDARHLDKATGGHLLADRERFYVALQGPADPALKMLDGPNPGFSGGLAAVPVNGRLYAFDRQSGARRWVSELPAQMLLLEQFEELPILVCSASSTRTNPADANNNLQVIATRSLDKHTGKLLYNREVWQNIDLFHTLRVDPGSGAIDLIAATYKLRHIPAGEK
jgi:hypothetical protein